MGNTFLLFAYIIIAFIFGKIILQYALSKPKPKNTSVGPSMSPTPGTFAQLNSQSRSQSVSMSPYVSKDNDMPYIYRNYRGGGRVGI